MSRARAERMLQGVLRRVDEVNAKPHFLCRVVEVSVLGAYVTDISVLDTLDLVVRIAPKPPAPGSTDTVFRPERDLPYWRLQKLLPPHEWPHWRERHVELYLVAGSPHVVLHRVDDPSLRRAHLQRVFPTP